MDVKGVADSLRAKTGVRLHGLLDLSYYISGNKLLSIKAEEYLTLEAIKNASDNVKDSSSFSYEAMKTALYNVGKCFSFTGIKNAIRKMKEYHGWIKNAHYEVREYVHFWILRSKTHSILKLKLKIYNRSTRKHIQNEIAAWGFDLYKMSYKTRIPFNERKSVDKIFNHFSEFLDKSNDSIDNVVPDGDNSSNRQTDNQNHAFGSLCSWIKKKLFEGFISKLISIALFVISPYICYLLELHKYPYLQYFVKVFTGRRSIDPSENEEN